VVGHGFDSLRPEDFDALLDLRREIVLLGTGRRQRFPHPRLTMALARAGVGVEVMDTAAACRTYNILMSEGRRVLAAISQEDKCHADDLAIDKKVPDFTAAVHRRCGEAVGTEGKERRAVLLPEGQHARLHDRRRRLRRRPQEFARPAR
jgi:hypothetical protein